MRLWKARSITYKTHFFSALCRGIFTNSCWIFGTSLFVKAVGSKGYSQLYLFASLSALLYYIYFAFRGHRGQEAYTFYKVWLIFALLASIGCFLEPFCAVLQPWNELLLYLFVIAVMTVDLIGTTVGPIVLQGSVNPAIFRNVYQKIVTMEGIARIVAAAVVWLLSQGHLLVFLYPIAWIALIVHFILFGITVWRMRVYELKARIPKGAETPALQNVSSSIRFLIANPLVRVAMIVMVWSIVTKFVLEYLFYQVADSNFNSARQIASFVSVTTITIYMLSLVVHHFISRKLTSKWQLSSLLSVQPINIILLGGIALLIPPFWPIVLLMVTYNIIHRSIQLPMSRQCLVPVPRVQRGTIVSLISIVVSLATIVMSGSMTALKNVLHLQDFLVLLLLLGSSIFFVITSLDSYYIRNLWSFFRELKSGSWQDDDPQSETLSPAALETPDSVEDALTITMTADIKSDPIVDVYAHSYDCSKLSTVVHEHRQLLQSKSTDLLSRGLKICFLAGFPWFATTLSQAAEDNDAKVRRLAEKALEISRVFPEMEKFSSVFRRRIKAVALEVLDSSEEEKHIAALKRLIQLPNQTNVESIVAALADVRFRDLRFDLFSCITRDDMTLTVKPIVEHMYVLDYASALGCRQLLQQLPFGKGSSDLLPIIEAELALIKRDELPLGRPAEEVGAEELHRFMHTLFLEEYRLSPRGSDGAIMETISEFEFLSPDESAIFVDMHLSFLKRSELFSSWQELLG